MPLETTLYTRVGDDGYTGVLGRERVAKYDLQPVAYGTVDELSALLGLARVSVQHTCSNDILLEVQRDLYAAMADLATTPEAAEKSGVRLYEPRIDWLEGIVDEIGRMVEIPPAFIVAGRQLRRRAAGRGPHRQPPRRAPRCQAAPPGHAQQPRRAALPQPPVLAALRPVPPGGQGGWRRAVHAGQVGKADVTRNS